jgi:hypothetical protein
MTKKLIHIDLAVPAELSNYLRQVAVAKGWNGSAVAARNLLEELRQDDLAAESDATREGGGNG